MAPIRTAVVGLSSNAITSWAANAHIPYLLSPAGKSNFQIIALCNSSVDAAKRAIEAYSLAPETRAYGSPEDLAADPNVQLVVCCTRVDKHYETVLPSVRNGKDVYVEWPLAENAAKAQQLASLAREKGGRTAVGLQGWFAPAVVKLRDLVESRRIGKVLSSEVRAAGGTLNRSVLPTGLKYFTDRKIGGNPFTIGFGHLFDMVQFAIGDIQNAKSHLQIQRPYADIRDPSSGKIVEVVKSDVPDLIHVIGSLPESETTVKGATLHIRYRRGQSFKGEPPLVWTINGEKGEIRLIATGGPTINASSHGEPLTIDVHEFETDEVQKVDWDWGAHAELPVLARNIAALYEAYAAGDATQYAGFEHAAKRHTQLDDMLTQFDGVS
ncbi:hypothetical protein BJ170DRAFT_228189 [Xylariales sp. AK1849]|nr:hypothetical protein BJ170DRAFT_228189 [Xylariales sp. AK1849]